MKRILCALLCLTLLASCSAPASVPTVQEPLPSLQSAEELTAALAARDGYHLRAVVLHGEEGGCWRETLEYLEQPMMLNLEAEAMDLSADFSGADVLYLDESLLTEPSWDTAARQIMDFTKAGGAVLVPNAFSGAFPAEYLGASDFEPLTFREEIVLPAGLGDLSDLQGLIADFHALYKGFTDYETLKGRDYGVAMVPDTAVPLVLSDDGGLALYAVNRWGEGAVLFTNPLLPNGYVQGDLSMAPRDLSQPAFASTVASCNQLFLSEWAAYVSKLRYGFALDRVFGCYGSPSMCWSLHYEEITAFENDSLRQFSALAEAAGQIPSLVLIRNAYQWFARVETMTYLLGQAEGTPFRMDYQESAYSSGAHVDSGGQWLTQGWLEEGGSYFDDHPEFRQRLSPCAVDYNGDGLADFFCGASDGSVTYYENLGMTGLDGRLRVSEAQPVFTTDGSPLKMDYYTATAMMDVDGDVQLDLLVGGPDGNVHWYRGDGTLFFEPKGILIETGFHGVNLPAAGDIDGDGVTDLAVGSEQGILLIYFGQKVGKETVYSSSRMAALSRDCADWELGHWLAPFLTDYDGDGKTDLLVGTFDGYIALLLGNGKGQFFFDGYLRCNENNYKGNDRIKFGNFATPLLLDLNGDGVRDLLCGHQEYGMNYPIDSPYFPQRDKLQDQINFAKARHYYTGLHFYTNSYASEEREAFELSAHKKAMEAYGIQTEGIGANQHTWYTSTLDPAQSMRSLWNAGLLWQSGYAGAGSTYIAPQMSPEAAVSLPFFLTSEGERTLLMQNCSVLPYCDETVSDISGKYAVPVVVYYHCDLIYRSDEEARDYIEKLSVFQRKFGYNFTREDQLMKASAAAYNLTVEVQAADGGFVITPGAASTDFPLYDGTFQRAAGLRIDFTDGLEEMFTPDARVWKRTADGFAVGLDAPVTFCQGGGEGQHVLQLNVPAEIAGTDAGAEISFTGDGMLQAVVSGNAETADEGWTADHYDGMTVFTKFGGPTALHVRYMGGN